MWPVHGKRRLSRLLPTVERMEPWGRQLPLHRCLARMAEIAFLSLQTPFHLYQSKIYLTEKEPIF